MLNPVREGEEDYIEAIRYRRRLKIFENFLFFSKTVKCPKNCDRGCSSRNWCISFTTRLAGQM